MHKTTVEPNFTDDRGTITDLVVDCVDAVTIVRTNKGAIRGNHYHAETTQWAHVLSGQLLVTDGRREMIVGAGETVRDDPGEPHAWKALEDTVCVVFVVGPRAGDAYESDVYRLKEPLIR